MFERNSKIRKFKSIYPRNTEGINYAHVIATLIYDTSLKGILKRCMFSIFFKTKYTITPESDSPYITCFSALDKKRDSYNKIYKQLLNELPATTRLTTTEVVSPLQPLKILKHFLISVREISTSEFKTLDKLSIALLVAKYKAEFQKIKTIAILKDKRTLITFCDAMPIDNLLTQHAVSLKIKTITNQHGQYRKLSDKNMSPDAEAYENFISDRLFCWGNATKQEFINVGFAEERLVVTGKISPPLENCRSTSESNLFGVLFNGENNKKINHTLLKAAHEISLNTKLKFIVRLHPNNSPKEYNFENLKQCEGFGLYSDSEYIRLAKFSIGHMTGAIVDLLRNSHRTFLLDDGQLADVFRLNHLSYASTDLIVAELKTCDHESSIQKTIALYRWFNDDADQQNSILKELRP